MCGIAGIVDPNSSAEKLAETGRQFVRSLRHRGPDDQGIWQEKSFGLMLAHSRLAIQDLSEFGHQPMLSASGRYCLVLNGEIYNFLELRHELQCSGWSFRGRSDTEVLLASIEEWGLDVTLDRLVGMFAFALWDGKLALLHLARDRMGEKPLYYGCVDRAFCFSSEIGALECVSFRENLEVSSDATIAYLQYGYVPAPLSIYSGILKLPPGSSIAIDVGEGCTRGEFRSLFRDRVAKPRVYWSLEDIAARGQKNQIADPAEAIHELNAQLKRSIDRQLISDVPLGAFLSGGIDSSLVCAVAQSRSTEKLRTFTVGFEEPQYDESGFAEKVAEHLGTNHQTIMTSAKEALDLVPSVVDVYDEPFADSSQLPAYLVSQLAREHVTVCLTGDGGDELFGGYNRYLWAQRVWAGVSSLPHGVRRLLGQITQIPGDRLWGSLGSLVVRGIRNEYAKPRQIGLKIQKAASFIQFESIEQAYEYLLSVWHRPSEVLLNGEGSALCSRFGSNWQGSFIERAMLHDQLHYLPGDNLVKVDRASMAVGLESRLPLLDHELVELSWRIPLSAKIFDGATKAPLRGLLYEYVPEALIDRPKMGFSVPVADWLRSELRDWSSDLLSSGSLVEAAGLDAEVLRCIHQEHLKMHRDHSQKLWCVLMLLGWLGRRRFGSRA